MVVFTVTVSIGDAAGVGDVVSIGVALVIDAVAFIEKAVYTAAECSIGVVSNVVLTVYVHAALRGDMKVFRVIRVYEN